MRGMVVILVTLMVCSCGSQKLQVREEHQGNTLEVEKLEARILSTIEALRLLDVEFRQEVRRDSAGNERIETTGKVTLKEKVEERDTTDVNQRVDTREEVKVEKNMEKEKISSTREWGWIIWGMAIIVIGLVVYKLKK